MVELAAGAASGWIYTLARTQPELAARLGIRSGARIRQWHLDLAMLGTATVADGLAFRAYAGASFVLTTVGFVGMAAEAVRRTA